MLGVCKGLVTVWLYGNNGFLYTEILQGSFNDDTFPCSG